MKHKKIRLLNVQQRKEIVNMGLGMYQQDT